MTASKRKKLADKVRPYLKNAQLRIEDARQMLEYEDFDETLKMMDWAEEGLRHARAALAEAKEKK